MGLAGADVILGTDIAVRGGIVLVAEVLHLNWRLNVFNND